MAGMNILEVRDLSFDYEYGQRALQGVSLMIGEGTSTAVLGANGAGKSTLFLHLNGVHRPQAGQVLFRGVPVRYDRKGLLDLRQRVGIVFQDPNDQLFSANVRGDISFGPLNLGWSQERVRAKVTEVMEQLSISHLQDRPTHGLSFGQKKRVAVAGVLAMEPEVLILDEPTAGLDPAGVHELLSLLTGLQRQQGMTLLLSTHDIDLVPLYCQQACVLHQGRLVAQGDVGELLKQPQLLRQYGLRLPRIAHLMEILQQDGLATGAEIATIGAGRRAIHRLLSAEE